MYLELLLTDQNHIDLAFTLKAGQIWSEPLSLSNSESLQFKTKLSLLLGIEKVMLSCDHLILGQLPHLAVLVGRP